jgi:hypothetical protein
MAAGRTQAAPDLARLVVAVLFASRPFVDVHRRMGSGTSVGEIPNASVREPRS